MHDVSIGLVLRGHVVYAAAVGHQQRENAGDKAAVVQLEGKAEQQQTLWRRRDGVRGRENDSEWRACVCCLAAFALQIIGTEVRPADDAGEHAAGHERSHGSLAVTVAQEGETCACNVGSDETETRDDDGREGGGGTAAAREAVGGEILEQLLPDTLTRD